MELKMCFSATASFVAGGILSVAGAATMISACRQKLGRGLIFLSSFPLVFGLQQSLEGLVWLGISDQLSLRLFTIVNYGFIFFAFFYWPVAGPTAGFLIEKRKWRKHLFGGLIIGGLAVGTYLMLKAINNPVLPTSSDEWGGHILYLQGMTLIPNIQYIYFFTACTALAASSNPTAFKFGLALTASFLVTLFGYELFVLPSVWCFFAALCSIVISYDVLRGKTVQYLEKQSDDLRAIV